MIMKVNNTSDLRIAYSILNLIEALPASKKPAKFFVDCLKRNVRDFTHSVPSYLASYSGFDYVLCLEKVPKGIHSIEEAELWFEDERKLTYYPTPYDCSGQIYTVQHKIFERNGELLCYHLTHMDV